MTKNNILMLQSGSGMTGGIANYIAGLVGSVSLKNFKFTVCVAHGEVKDILESRKYGNANLIEMKSTYGYLSLISILLKFKSIVVENNINLIHCHALRSGLICALLKILYNFPYVYTNHGLRYKQKKNIFKSYFFYNIELFVIRHSSQVYCVRESDAQELRKIKNNACYSIKINTIETRINNFDIKGEFYENIIWKKIPRIIGIGSIIQVKRVDRFIDWLASLSLIGFEYDAIWIGDGELRLQMENLARNSNVSIKWLGHVNSSNVHNELEHANLMFLTSDFEVMPLAALEAMSHGIPIIATNFFGVSDFLQNKKNGLIISDSALPCQIANDIKEFYCNINDYSAAIKYTKNIFSKRFKDAELMCSDYALGYCKVLKG